VVGASPMDSRRSISLPPGCGIVGTNWSIKRYLNIELVKNQQRGLPSPLEPVPGAAQPK
jgi:hypothetical protein